MCHISINQLCLNPEWPEVIGVGYMSSLYPLFVYDILLEINSAYKLYSYHSIDFLSFLLPSLNEGHGLKFWDSPVNLPWMDLHCTKKRVRERHVLRFSFKWSPLFGQYPLVLHCLMVKKCVGKNDLEMIKNAPNCVQQSLRRAHILLLFDFVFASNNERFDPLYKIICPCFVVFGRQLSFSQIQNLLILMLSH